MPKRIKYLLSLSVTKFVTPQCPLLLAQLSLTSWSKIAWSFSNIAFTLSAFIGLACHSGLLDFKLLPLLLNCLPFLCSFPPWRHFITIDLIINGVICTCLLLHEFRRFYDAHTVPAGVRNDDRFLWFANSERVDDRNVVSDTFDDTLL